MGRHATQLTSYSTTGEDVFFPFSLCFSPGRDADTSGSHPGRRRACHRCSGKRAVVGWDEQWEAGGGYSSLALIRALSLWSRAGWDHIAGPFLATSSERGPQGQSGRCFLHGWDVISRVMGTGEARGWGGISRCTLSLQSELEPPPSFLGGSVKTCRQRRGVQPPLRWKSLCLLPMCFNNTPRSLGAFLPSKLTRPPALAKDTHCHRHRRRRWCTGGGGGGHAGFLLWPQERRRKRKTTHRGQLGQGLGASTRLRRTQLTSRQG